MEATHIAQVPIDFGRLPWRDRSDIFGAAIGTVLKAYIHTGSIYMHCVAFRVAVDDNECQTTFAPDGETGDAEEHFIALHQATGSEGHLGTVEIGGFSYAVFMSPFCD